MFVIRADDLSDPQTQALLALHLSGMQASSPPEAVTALDVGGLRRPGIDVFSAWQGKRIAGIGALRRLSPEQGEVKSMRTHPDFLRQGVAAGLLAHIVAAARGAGLRLLSLETGTGAAFEAATALYLSRGFVPGAVFGDYVDSDFNRFFHLTL